MAMDYERAFRILNVPPKQYIVKQALPMVAGGIFMAVVLWFVGGAILPGILKLVIPPALVLISIFLAAFYPLSAADQKRVEIDNALPFFITHFGVLSTANMPRTEVFRILGEKEEYKALAEETRRIYSLVEDWKMSLPEAARFVSLTTPSEIFGDLLDRLAHAMETGQPLDAFLRSEQSVVMKEYSTVYETSIYQIENWKEIYISAIMSGAFFVIFAVITPVITGTDPTMLLLGVLGFVLFLEIILLFVLKARTPEDQLHYELDIPTREKGLIMRATAAGAVATGLLIFILVLATPLPVGVAFAIGTIPLLPVGMLAKGYENRIKRREENYSAFIRSLGASAASKGGSPREVLKQVKTHNFGPLTDMVENLYARLTWRLNDPLAWKYFSAESGSKLVESFNDMFIEGISFGGKPDQIGEIISDNVVRILNLRKARYSTAGTFRGMIIGMTASMAFVMFIGVGILGVMSQFFDTTQDVAEQAAIDENVTAENDALAGEVREIQQVGFLADINADVELLQTLVLVLIFIHCFIAGVALKLVDGGSIPAGFDAFVIMLWLAIALALGSELVLESMFDFGSEGAASSAPAASPAPSDQ